ncbi:hypothetical protein ABPG72_022768 [Tetrahymena utriculariae]
MKAKFVVLLLLVLFQVSYQQDPILIPGFLSNPQAATNQDTCDNYEAIFDEQELKIVEQIEQIAQAQAQASAQAQAGAAQQNAAGQSLFIRYPYCFCPYYLSQAANPQATPNAQALPIFYPYWPYYCCCCCYRYPYIFDLATAQANQQAGQPGGTSSSGTQQNAQAIPNFYPYPYYPYWCCHPYPYYLDAAAAAAAQANQQGSQQNSQQGTQQNSQQGTQQNAQAKFLPYYPYWPHCCCCRYPYPYIYELQANPQASQQNSQGTTGQQNTQSNSQQSTQPPPQAVNLPAISQNIYQKCLQCKQKEKDCDRELDCVPIIHAQEESVYHFHFEQNDFEINIFTLDLQNSLN